MKHFAATAFALILLAGCQEAEKAGATTETSPGGIEYTRLYIPKAEDVAIQIAWPSTWALRDDVNQAVPYIGTDLILAGGAKGFPPGEVVETFADLKAEGTMWVTADHLHGQLIAPKDNLDKAVEIAAAHLAKPTMDQGWFERIQQGFAANMAETTSQPANRGYDAPETVHLVEAFDGIGLRPYPVAHLRATPAGADLAITWTRRTRIDGDSWASVEVPLGEEAESYTLRILQGTTLLREETTASPNWTYTAAQQATDAATGTITIHVAQLSQRFGAGPFRSISVDI